MTDTVDTAMLELLASKICHDLISPIGAINNGLELLEDMGAAAGDEVTGLIAFSTNQASAKLQAFRMAYGQGGADGNIKPEDVHKTLQLIVGAENKIVQDWDPHANLGAAAQEKGFCKILMCALLLGMESLPKGGKLLVSGQGGQTLIRAQGTGAGLRGDAGKALKLEIKTENLQPQDVHACMTGLMARLHGFRVAAASSAESLDLHIAAA